MTPRDWWHVIMIRCDSEINLLERYEAFYVFTWGKKPNRRSVNMSKDLAEQIQKDINEFIWNRGEFFGLSICRVIVEHHSSRLKSMNIIINLIINLRLGRGDNVIGKTIIIQHDESHREYNDLIDLIFKRVTETTLQMNYQCIK